MTTTTNINAPLHSGMEGIGYRRISQGRDAEKGAWWVKRGENYAKSVMFVARVRWSNKGERWAVGFWGFVDGVRVVNHALWGGTYDEAVSNIAVQTRQEEGEIPF